ncbi:hypothetical protein IMSAGC014_00521 [Bacteroidaceae bacterium]|uniref:DUF4292 domain-containing protein n=1 Tax=Prevotella sp. MGM2 TaxID=2033406 RepID=UPI000CEA36FA|nr:DUF4292 domain-containing protein [Prevotella sp. MGM2]GFI34033.1 hypothetical protein IMSAGC014_00521 [Bacteroidaceae bacterium]
MKPIIALLLTALTLTACHSSKNLTKTPAPSTSDTSASAGEAMSAAATEFAGRIAATSQKASTLTAKINMDLNALGKNVSVGGSLKMKKDDVVQLSLSFLGFEVGRLEFTPTSVLIVDRVNKQYVRTGYDQVGFLNQANLDFYTLQALFWGELFIPGQHPLTTPGRFRLSEAGDHTLLSLTDSPWLEYSFLAATKTALVDRVNIQGKNAADKGTFTWRYGNRTTVGGQPFPTTMACNVSGIGKDMSFSLTLSRLNNDSGWTTRTALSDKYTRREADDILGRLLSL